MEDILGKSHVVSGEKALAGDLASELISHISHDGDQFLQNMFDIAWVHELLEGRKGLFLYFGLGLLFFI